MGNNPSTYNYTKEARYSTYSYMRAVCLSSVQFYYRPCLSSALHIISVRPRVYRILVDIVHIIYKNLKYI
jgi:hypothetical protein